MKFKLPKQPFLSIIHSFSRGERRDVEILEKVEKKKKKKERQEGEGNEKNALEKDEIGVREG